MQYKLTSEFQTITETEGIMYVPDKSVEIASGTSIPDKGTGIFMNLGDKLEFSATTSGSIYARAASSSALLNVVGIKHA